MRKFTDERGTEWRVFAMHSASLSEGSRQSLPEQWRKGWLVFENGVERRRLAPFPAKWSDLPDEALRELCEAGVPASTPASGSLSISTGEMKTVKPNT